MDGQEAPSGERSRSDKMNPAVIDSDVFRSLLHNQLGSPEITPKADPGSPSPPNGEASRYNTLPDKSEDPKALKKRKKRHKKQRRAERQRRRESLTNGDDDAPVMRTFSPSSSSLREGASPHCKLEALACIDACA